MEEAQEGEAVIYGSECRLVMDQESARLVTKVLDWERLRLMSKEEKESMTSIGRCRGR